MGLVHLNQSQLINDFQNQTINSGNQAIRDGRVKLKNIAFWKTTINILTIGMSIGLGMATKGVVSPAIIAMDLAIGLGDAGGQLALSIAAGNISVLTTLIDFGAAVLPSLLPIAKSIRTNNKLKSLLTPKTKITKLGVQTEVYDEAFQKHIKLTNDYENLIIGRFKDADIAKISKLSVSDLKKEKYINEAIRDEFRNRFKDLGITQSQYDVFIKAMSDDVYTRDSLGAYTHLNKRIKDTLEPQAEFLQKLRFQNIKRTQWQSKYHPVTGYEIKTPSKGRYLEELASDADPSAIYALQMQLATKQQRQAFRTSLQFKNIGPKSKYYQSPLGHDYLKKLYLAFQDLPFPIRQALISEVVKTAKVQRTFFAKLSSAKINATNAAAFLRSRIFKSTTNTIQKSIIVQNQIIEDALRHLQSDIISNTISKRAAKKIRGKLNKFQALATKNSRSLDILQYKVGTLRPLAKRQGLLRYRKDLDLWYAKYGNQLANNKKLTVSYKQGKKLYNIAYNSKTSLSPLYQVQSGLDLNIQQINKYFEFDPKFLQASKQIRDLNPLQSSQLVQDVFQEIANGFPSEALSKKGLREIVETYDHLFKYQPPTVAKTIFESSISNYVNKDAIKRFTYQYGVLWRDELFAAYAKKYAPKVGWIKRWGYYGSHAFNDKVVQRIQLIDANDAGRAIVERTYQYGKKHYEGMLNRIYKSERDRIAKLSKSSISIDRAITKAKGYVPITSRYLDSVRIMNVNLSSNSINKVNIHEKMLTLVRFNPLNTGGKTGGNVGGKGAIVVMMSYFDVQQLVAQGSSYWWGPKGRRNGWWVSRGGRKVTSHIAPLGAQLSLFLGIASIPMLRHVWSLISNVVENVWRMGVSAAQGRNIVQYMQGWLKTVRNTFSRGVFNRLSRFTFRVLIGSTVKHLARMKQLHQVGALSSKAYSLKLNLIRYSIRRLGLNLNKIGSSFLTPLYGKDAEGNFRFTTSNYTAKALNKLGLGAAHTIRSAQIYSVRSKGKLFNRARSVKSSLAAKRHSINRKTRQIRRGYSAIMPNAIGPSPNTFGHIRLKR